MSDSPSPPTLFADVTAKHDSGTLFLRLVGPTIGARETPIIQTMADQALDDFGPSLRHLVINLSAVTFMNSTALGMLLNCRNRARKAGDPKVILIGLNEDMLSLLKTIKIDGLFVIARGADDLAKALER